MTQNKQKDVTEKIKIVQAFQQKVLEQELGWGSIKKDSPGEQISAALRAAEEIHEELEGHLDAFQKYCKKIEAILDL